MPAGVTWPKYLKIVTATFLSMLAGAQTVHKFYKPDLEVKAVQPGTATILSIEQPYEAVGWECKTGPQH